MERTPSERLRESLRTALGAGSSKLVPTWIKRDMGDAGREVARKLGDWDELIASRLKQISSINCMGHFSRAGRVRGFGPQPENNKLLKFK